MDASKTKQIVIALVLVVAAIGITIYTQTGDSGGSIYMLCEDGTAVALTPEEYQFQMDEEGIGINMRVRSSDKPTFESLPQCDGGPAWKAVKCENCGHVFKFDGLADDPTKCPECGYSKKEGK